MVLDFRCKICLQMHNTLTQRRDVPKNVFFLNGNPRIFFAPFFLPFLNLHLRRENVSYFFAVQCANAISKIFKYKSCKETARKGLQFRDILMRIRFFRWCKNNYGFPLKKSCIWDIFRFWNYMLLTGRQILNPVPKYRKWSTVSITIPVFEIPMVDDGKKIYQ